MKQWIVACLTVVFVSCASLTPLQRAQQTHDYLALAQDTEVSLCLGVPNVAAALAANVPPNHCTTPTAATIGLTDARHRAFEAQMAKALELHKAATTLLASAGAADLTALKQAITDLLSLVGQLTGASVSNLTLYLQKASAQ